ncbi:MAG TPA: twin-arginine translocase TatA/TatE family subunit [Bryobacteraceae bacterium]|nr:twin-arginine translocase TatA/TatE family subunit [Bryobacteraceae bacterium]
MGPIGVQEMIVIFIVALVLFGPKKLPELGRTIGKALTEFRRATSDLKSSFEREMHNLEREAELKETTESIAKALPSASEYYSYNDFAEYIPETYDNDTATNSTTVSASEVPGAESPGTVPESPEIEAVPSEQETAAATPGVEGTVPRV